MPAQFLPAFVCRKEGCFSAAAKFCAHFRWRAVSKNLFNNAPFIQKVIDFVLHVAKINFAIMKFYILGVSGLLVYRKNCDFFCFSFEFAGRQNQKIIFFLFTKHKNIFPWSARASFLVSIFQLQRHPY